MGLAKVSREAARHICSHMFQGSQMPYDVLGLHRKCDTWFRVVTISTIQTWRMMCLNSWQDQDLRIKLRFLSRRDPESGTVQAR